MNTGVPPTAPNARTGEFTPPAMTALARREQLGGSVRASHRQPPLARVGQELQQPQPVGQRSGRRRAARQPARRERRRRPGTAGRARSCSGSASAARPPRRRPRARSPGGRTTIRPRRRARRGSPRRTGPGPPALIATGPGRTAGRSIMASAAAPAAAGTSSTSNTRPVARMMLASGWAAHRCCTTPGSAVAWICQAGDIGCAPGAGQPIRSQEQARPALRGAAARRVGAQAHRPAQAGVLGGRRRHPPDVPAPAPAQYRCDHQAPLPAGPVLALLPYR